MQRHYPRFQDMDLEQRNARRALAAKVAKLHGGAMTHKKVGLLLGISPTLVHTLLYRPMPSERQMKEAAERNALARKARKQRAAQRNAEWREAWRQRQQDEAYEAKANAFVCLIEALAEMRPYVGTEAP